MHNFRIPPSPTWYSHAVCTPNNGFLYIAGNHTSITYIPPIDQNAAESNDQTKCSLQLESNLRVIQTPNTNRLALQCQTKIIYWNLIRNNKPL